MKFIFKNLGPIHEAELELGDLTIIAGRNNTGKTYVAYTLYGFLKMWLGFPPPFFPEIFHPSTWKTRASHIMPHLPDMEEIAKEVMEGGQAKWSADREKMTLVRQGMMQIAARYFSEENLAKVFSAPRDNFERASLEIALEEALPEGVPTRISPFTNGDEFTLTYNNDEMRIRRSKIGFEPSADPPSSVLLFELLMFLFPRLPDPFILSAERFGISLFYKELDFTKNRLVEALQEIGQEEDRAKFLPFTIIDKMANRYALPIRDNINYTRSLPDLQNRRSELLDTELFKDIEAMIGGYYGSSSDDIRFISKAWEEHRFDIPLHIASSSVRGLSDLYFFLRYLALKDRLIIIDEPESHLDTHNQIQFARLLARAVHAGLKVLITTHSDYIVKEINNLLMLSKDFKEKPRVLKKHGYSEHDFLKPESVRAYVAENNSLTRCTIDRFGINMPVFDKTIDAINRVSSELESRLTYEGEE